MLEAVQQFERIRVEVGGRGITVTSWYEPDKNRWRGSAPALLHLLAGADTQQLSGATRDKAIAAVSGVVAQRFARATS